MSKQTSRRDFISDNSSSDDDLPQISLRERLERKQAISTFSLLKDDTASAAVHVSRTGPSDIEQRDTCVIDSDDCLSNTDTNFQATLPNVTSTNPSGQLPTGVPDVSTVPGPPNAKKGKKRTQEEIEDSRRKALEKKEQRERIKMAKEAEKQMKKAERETKKQFSLGSCLNYITVLVDTHIVNTCGYGMAVFKACEELGVSCQTQELPSPFTVMWRRTLTECSRLDQVQVQTSKNEVMEGEMLAIIPVQDFVHMVHTYKQEQKVGINGGVTLRRYVQQLQHKHRGQNITTLVTGVEQYFRELKSQANKKHREAVSSTKQGSKPGKENSESIKVSRVDIEEALTDTFLHTSAGNYMMEGGDEVADLVRRFTKAVAEKPAKKDRFDAKFSFHEEGASGVKVDKNGIGLLKVWKQQLMQLKNVSQDVAQALIAEYPSPRLLEQAYERCNTEKECISLLENIVVRRGAGVLETSRRVGKELSRRLYTLFTQEDPDFVIK